jgi:hypothetical protein
VNDINDAPVLDLDVNNSSTAINADHLGDFIAGAGEVKIADIDTGITDVDDTNIETATITLTNAQTADVLSAGTLPAGITIDTDNSTATTIVLTGSASLADYQTAIAAIRFNNANSNPDSTPRTINVVVNDGTTDSNTAVSTINIFVPPVNSVPTLVATDVSTALAFDGLGSNPTVIISNDADDDLSTVQLTVSGGTISVGGDIAGGAALTVTGDGTNTITITRGTDTEVDLNAMLSNLVYTPASEGDVTLTTVSTDALGLTDTDITTIRVVGTPTTPTLADLEGSIPVSTGLFRSEYESNDQIFFLGGDGSVNNPNNVVFDASTIEGLADAATPVTATRDADGVGTGIGRNTGIVNTVNGETANGENSLIVYTGLIYLTADVEYSISGYIDDAAHIELGGKTILSTSIAGADAGFISNISGTTGAATFTADVDGYYTIEMYLANIDANGGFLINLDANSSGTPGAPGVPFELNAQNYNIYAGVDDLIAVGGQIGSFQSNGTDGNPDGGYFSVATGVDLVGVIGQPISLALLALGTEPSDVIKTITISDIPIGVIISDGAGNIFNNNVGETNDGATSHMFTPQSSLNSGAAFWDMAGLNITGLTATQTLTIDAVATTLTGIGESVPMTGETVTIGVLPADYAGTGATAVDDAIASTTDDGIVFGSGSSDNLSANDTGQLVYGASGNDVILGGSGNDVLFGDTGEDIIKGGDSNDLIIGGQGDDILTGDGGRDTFAWALGDETGASTDTVTDFNQAPGGDILDFSGLLTGEHAGNYNDFITLTGSTLTVDTNGDGSGTDLTINLTGLTATTVDDLVANGSIVFGDDRAVYQGLLAPDSATGLTGTTEDDVFFSGGMTGAGDESVTGNGGNDTYVLEAAANTPSDSNDVDYDLNSLSRLRDFDFRLPGIADDESDTIDLSDLFEGKLYLDGKTLAQSLDGLIDINFNPFNNEDIIRIYLDGDATGDATGTASINLELKGINANLDSIFGHSVGPSPGSGDGVYNSVAEADILAQLIANGNLIVE